MEAKTQTWEQKEGRQTLLVFETKQPKGSKREAKLGSQTGAKIKPIFFSRVNRRRPSGVILERRKWHVFQPCLT